MKETSPDAAVSYFPRSHSNDLRLRSSSYSTTPTPTSRRHPLKDRREDVGVGAAIRPSVCLSVCLYVPCPEAAVTETSPAPFQKHSLGGCTVDISPSNCHRRGSYRFVARYHVGYVVVFVVGVIVSL